MAASRNFSRRDVKVKGENKKRKKKRKKRTANFPFKILNLSYNDGNGIGAAGLLMAFFVYRVAVRFYLFFQCGETGGLIFVL